MSERIVARIVWVVAALALVAAVFVVWREVGSGTAMEMAGAVAWVLLTPLLVLTGALIVSRQPDNIIGLLLMVPGLIFLATRVVDIIAGPLATSEARISSPWASGSVSGSTAGRGCCSSSLSSI